MDQVPPPPSGALASARSAARHRLLKIVSLREEIVRHSLEPLGKMLIVTVLSQTGADASLSSQINRRNHRKPPAQACYREKPIGIRPFRIEREFFRSALGLRPAREVPMTVKMCFLVPVSPARRRAQCLPIV
jgi:hypothetical protein